MKAGRLMERVNGIEPSSSAWEAEVIPLYDTRLSGHPTWAWALVNTRLALATL